MTKQTFSQTSNIGKVEDYSKIEYQIANEDNSIVFTVSGLFTKNAWSNNYILEIETKDDYYHLLFKKIEDAKVYMFQELKNLAEEKDFVVRFKDEL